MKGLLSTGLPRLVFIQRAEFIEILADIVDSLADLLGGDQKVLGEYGQGFWHKEVYVLEHTS